MEVGMIGLGRMGGEMARRLLAGGHRCVVYNRTLAPVEALQREGAVGTRSIEEFVARLTPPRRVWLMLPAAAVDATIALLAPLLDEGDTIIDGGNSYYRDDIRRERELRPRGIAYVDVGTSGGVWGRERGYCLMIGGDKLPVTILDPVFATLAPGIEAAPRIPGAAVGTAEQGYMHCGPAGAGHFVKMVHNGIEYGMMAALAEGFAILEHADAGGRTRKADAETAPLRHPEAYRYNLDLAAISELWRRGSVVSSWLLELTARALRSDASLSGFDGRVSDSGEGRWTVAAAIEEGVPAPVLATALFQRFSSRGNDLFADRLLSAMRFQFGGHREKRGESR